MPDKIVAIIPARGESKRIPKKNIKSFAGQPIIAYSIKAALATGLFDRIIVSTDSQEIAQVARNWGAEVPFVRPAELADDYTGTAKVILHALNWLGKHYENVGTLCCIYPTAPFIQPEAIQKGYELLKVRGLTSVYSVTTFPAPIFRALKINETGRLEMIWPENLDTRSQDLPEAYHDAGQFYWADAKIYRKIKRFHSDNAMPVVIPRYLVHDIDTPEDWETAEKHYFTIHGARISV
ncbi:N-acylneuraminate cytidylyltransferase (EC [Olavius sp. associated proteobacterium Delta 1]|nr:N-acylneuraminate cytidylyltransferase (EC [Olavius sp. associated proteobacterium Delta 1]